MTGDSGIVTGDSGKAPEIGHDKTESVVTIARNRRSRSNGMGGHDGPEYAQDPNVEELAERIVAAGGKKRMEKPRYYYPGEKPYRMIYMEDPFGNIVEIYSHSYELIYSEGAY